MTGPPFMRHLLVAVSCYAGIVAGAGYFRTKPRNHRLAVPNRNYTHPDVTVPCSRNDTRPHVAHIADTNADHNVVNYIDRDPNSNLENEKVSDKGRDLIQMHGAGEDPDDYLDMDPNHPRDDVHLHSKRDMSSATEMSEHFSVLGWLLGGCTNGACLAQWTWHCTLSIVVSSLIMMWTFKNLKVLSDVYFVPACCVLAKRSGMPNDVAGATLLAFGSSAPELCTNIVATFLIVNDCGVGDIIGSAIHNISIVVGVSGLFAGRALALWWYPLTRDCLFYSISIIELTIFLWDEYIVWWEALVMCLTYVAYGLWMVWNLPIYEMMCKCFRCEPDVPSEGDDDDEEAEGLLYYDPCEIIWRLTMPDHKEKPFRCFAVSLCNVMLLSYWMVDSATVFGCVLGIPTLFMGLVFLAAGTSIPDAFASMAAARRGEGDMAVSNALGSNIFDILLGLGMPWLISILIGKPIVFHGVSRLLYWVILLMIILVAFMVTIVIAGWKLDWKMGGALVAFYVVYVIWALLKSFNVVDF
eukprot:gnl/TRDRNA2_/TRDRNA2_176398_c1_seq2.p1 gnl/TRDRNA2_/TRDRNA2_176398_c1~~gnl/TRDRNA2_/TRDRNA2_176398_c1_seq2.p1  ORF type:complete len:525 (+),score=43.35 gnl/TRDRNA2_/TRDRNA2_176398_c1_seq2:91-1665(+)